MTRETIAEVVQVIEPPKDWDDFVSRFRPLPVLAGDEEGLCFDGFRLSLHARDLNTVSSAFRASPKTIWTILEVDDAFYVVNGMHRVNRHGYIICDVPYEGGHCEFPAGESSFPDESIFRVQVFMNGPGLRNVAEADLKVDGTIDLKFDEAGVDRFIFQLRADDFGDVGESLVMTPQDMKKFREQDFLPVPLPAGSISFVENESPHSGCAFEVAKTLKNQRGQLQELFSTRVDGEEVALFISGTEDEAEFVWACNTPDGLEKLEPIGGEKMRFLPNRMALGETPAHRLIDPKFPVFVRGLTEDSGCQESGFVDIFEAVVNGSFEDLKEAFETGSFRGYVEKYFKFNQAYEVHSDVVNIIDLISAYNGKSAFLGEISPGAFLNDFDSEMFDAFQEVSREVLNCRKNVMEEPAHLRDFDRTCER